MKINILVLTLLLTAISANAQSPKFSEAVKKLSEVCKNDPIQQRIWFEYGAAYISKGAILPKKCRFEDEPELTKFTKKIMKPANKLSFGNFYLQLSAKQSLEEVIEEMGGYQYVGRICNEDQPLLFCNKTSKTIKLNDDWAARTFKESAEIWRLDTNKSKNEQIKSIKDILEIDEQNNQPQMFRKAVPGGSQHQLGLAIDVNNAGETLCKAKCTSALNKNGWYRTVPFDPYHFTYLGYSEDALPSKGLKQICCKDDERNKNFTYWVIDDIGQDYSYKYKNTRCHNVE